MSFNKASEDTGILLFFSPLLLFVAILPILIFSFLLHSFASSFQGEESE